MDTEGGVDYEKTDGNPTRCVRVMNVFDPAKVRDLSDSEYDEWKDDLEDDVGNEADRKGRIVHLRAKSSDDCGSVFLCMRTVSDAIMVASAFAGRYYDKRQLKTEYLLEDDYVERFPKVGPRLKKIDALSNGAGAGAGAGAGDSGDGSGNGTAGAPAPVASTMPYLPMAAMLGGPSSIADMYLN